MAQVVSARKAEDRMMLFCQSPLECLIVIFLASNWPLLMAADLSDIAADAFVEVAAKMNGVLEADVKVTLNGNGLGAVTYEVLLDPKSAKADVLPDGFREEIEKLRIQSEAARDYVPTKVSEQLRIFLDEHPSAPIQKVEFRREDAVRMRIRWTCEMRDMSNEDGCIHAPSKSYQSGDRWSIRMIAGMLVGAPQFGLVDTTPTGLKARLSTKVSGALFINFLRVAYLAKNEQDSSCMKSSLSIHFSPDRALLGGEKDEIDSMEIFRFDASPAGSNKAMSEKLQAAVQEHGKATRGREKETDKNDLRFLGKVEGVSFPQSMDGSFIFTVRGTGNVVQSQPEENQADTGPMDSEPKKKDKELPTLEDFLRKEKGEDRKLPAGKVP